MNSTTAQLREFRIIRWALVTPIVFVGVIVSVAVNQLDAHTGIGKGLAGWPPVSLLLTLELLTRIPASKRLGAIGRVLATIAVAGAAGWLSYWHMVAAVANHEETVINAHIWPLCVDGLMAIAAVGMVELGARIRMLKSQSQRVADAAASATDLIEAVNAVEPIAAIEATPVAPIAEQRMTNAEGVADMMTSPLWSQRLGRPGRRGK